jgi:mannose-1-phosphate guanylyltransferase
MAGGSGSRLWPLSRQLYPKQFHALTGERTLLQETAIRLDGLSAELPLLICNEEHRFLAAEQMRLIGREDTSILLEPVGRNTAPAIALAALYATRHGDDPVLLVLAADHFIPDVDRFCESVKKAAPLAEQGKLVTFGIVPDRNETGYGYILRGEALPGGGFVVGRFEEKPDRRTAEKYVKSGDYYWNSGMFLFRASRYLEELKRHRPEIFDACNRSISVTEPDMQFVRDDEEAELALPPPERELSLMIVDRAFDEDGQFRYPALAPGGTSVPRRLGLLVAKLLVSGGVAVLLCAATAVLNSAVIPLAFGAEVLSGSPGAGWVGQLVIRPVRPSAACRRRPAAGDPGRP